MTLNISQIELFLIDFIIFIVHWLVGHASPICEETLAKALIGLNPGTQLSALITAVSVSILMF